MYLSNIYYHFKPLIPRRAQIYIRRKIARYKLKNSRDIWPVHPEADLVPENWCGWPEGKKFALVLSHDVDTEKGKKNCLNLMELERRMGFRSCFNFVPRAYECENELRQTLLEKGFAIGLHGLTHEGKVFQSRKRFFRAVPEINYFLENWKIKTFSSPSMLGNLDWISQLNIEADCSTFDTDPFEPQANDIETIFPLIIINSDKTRSYVELPYTLPQDHCLFIILQMKDISLWKKKLDWIAEKGGMALLNTHPDYMSFPGQSPARETYPAEYYEEFLNYLKEKYSGQYWNALPLEMARFWKQNMPHHTFVLSPSYRQSAMSHLKKTIWIDLDNTPHVPFFIPIKKELKKRNYRVLLTGRNAFQVKELAQKNKLLVRIIGRHYGRHKIKKLLGWLYRTWQLMPFILKHKPDLAVSHGSRSQLTAARLLGITTVLIMDYEHSRPAPFSRPDWVIVPEILNKASLPSPRVLTYHGLKEDVYVPSFTPDDQILKQFGLSADDILVTIRPPATEAHYHNPAGEKLFFAVVDWLLTFSQVKIVMLPRNKKQADEIRNRKKSWFKKGQVIIPEQAIDGLDLIFFSDLVISGGGTMNREAASLGVPVYSIFRGPLGLIDKQLEKESRLVMIKSPEEFSKIKIEKREKTSPSDLKDRPALKQIVDHIEHIINEKNIGKSE
ncbi:MAG: DUF354 domain-containing protein [Candidatus Saccharicenans sp.]